MRDQELLRMQQAMSGRRLLPESDSQALWSAVEAGGDEVLLTLRWFPDQSDFHSLSLIRVEGERIHFHNPVVETADLPPGSELQDDAPPRIFHSPGDESVSRAEFESWFSERDALGYLPEP
jgi:hypothetical protein